MTKLHDDSLSLTGAQRNYRARGSKLKPRDAYDAHRSAHYGRSMRQLRRYDAAEARAMGYNYPDRRMDRLRKRMSTRAVKLVTAHINSLIGTRHEGHQADVTIAGRMRQRYANAVVVYINERAAREWDRKTLANAY